MDQLQIARLDARRVEDFMKVHSAENGADWCFCMAWHMENWDGFADRTAEQNCKARIRLLAGEAFDGYLLYDHVNPIGWMAAAPRGNFPNLVRTYGLEASEEVWAIGCVLIAPDRRRHGFATWFVRAVVADLAKMGVSAVEAFPHIGPELGEEDLWTGPEKAFVKAGFKLFRADRSHPILRLELDSR